MADTIETLTTSMDALQRQINDLSVTLQGYGTRLDTHDTDINALQNPPVGVPPVLLQWFAVPHSIREVDTILDTDLTTVSSNIASNTSDIADLSTRLDQEISDRDAADTDLNGTDIDLQAQIDTNLATLTQEITDRGTLSVTVSEGFDTINSRIDLVQADLTTATESATTSSGSLSSQIASLSAALQTAQTQINQLIGIGVDPVGAQAAQITSLTTIANDAATAVALETTNRTNADAALQTTVNSLSSSIAGIQSGLNNETNDRKTADIDIQSDITALTAEIAGHQALIDAETAARTSADSILTAAVADNSADIIDNSNAISDEVTNRTTADANLQTQVNTNLASITSNTAAIATHTTTITAINSRFSVVKDGGGYVTGFRIVDESGAASAFNLKDFNNNARLQNPGYVGKYFPAVSSLSFSPTTTYSTTWGGATSNDFQGTDLNNYTRLVKVYSTLSVGISGSCFQGVDYSTGGSLNRLGQVLTTFTVDFSGTVNRYLSLWYRIKNAPADTTQRWFPVALADNTTLSPRTYEYTRKQAVVQISATADKVIEFGLTVLNTLDATIANASFDTIYGGSVSVVATNMVTIS